MVSKPNFLNRPQRRIGPVTFEFVDRKSSINQMRISIRSNVGAVFVFCNMHTLNTARRNQRVAEALAGATVFNDGVGIEIASLILFGHGFPDNLNGTDLIPELLAALDQPTSVFLVGSKPGVVEQAAAALEKRFPLISIVGCHHGFFEAKSSEKIVRRIEESRADLLLVGMGNPRQELWAQEIVSKTPGTTVLCVGAFLDFTSGRIPRAPKWIRTVRAEWVYRMIKEPARLSGRYLLGGLSFLSAVLFERLTSKSRMIDKADARRGH